MFWIILTDPSEIIDKEKFRINNVHNTYWVSFACKKMHVR